MSFMRHDEIIDSAALAATLNQYGVRYLRTATAVAPLSLAPETLITAIAQHPQPRIREALILLFLRQPTFAQYVPELVDTLPETAATTLRHFYTASVYSQRLWRGKVDITAQSLRDFLVQMGRCYRHPGRIYLVGGSSLILVAAKTSTLDIDLKFEVSSKYHSEFIRCLRQLARQLKLPIEQASIAPLFS